MIKKYQMIENYSSTEGTLYKGEVYVSPDFVGENIQECISNPENKIDLSYDGWVSVNDILMEEGHAYEYDGGKKKVFNG